MMHGDTTTRESNIAILVNKNVVLVEKFTFSLAPDDVLYSKALFQLARFKLWARSIGAHRAPGPDSLDYKLCDASSIRQHVIKLLSQLNQAVEDALPTSQTYVPSPFETQSPLDAELAEIVDDNESDQSNVELALADIDHIVECLLRLSATIRNIAPYDQYMSRAVFETVSQYEQYDIKYVQEKFPRADNDLTERLGKLITSRRHFFKYREDHQDRVSGEVDEDDGLDRSGDQSTAPSPISVHLKNNLWSDLDATTYNPSGENLEELKIPPIPSEHVAGRFLCPFCYLMIKVDSPIKWKNHILRDSQPYVCLAPSCLTKDYKFSRRSEWTHHMMETHWRLWKCLCGHPQAFHEVSALHDHVKAMHPDSLTLHRPGTFEHMCSQPDLSKSVGPCPLCVEKPIGFATQYISHVGHHLEQLALFALPHITGDSDEAEGQRRAVEENKLDQGLSHKSPFPSNTVTNKSKWRWNCCDCGWESLSYVYDPGCTNCAHRRDAHCSVWATP
ncbi:hypothetical protein F4802DRAFT_569018 [Xylaria palmicola]|nr:hypothetical protein F4802DRAFT_569018 [Xylaria palmicola]